MSIQKQSQFVFASIGTIFLFRGFYYSDPNFFTTDENNIICIVLYCLTIVPILLWIAFFTNRWFYNESIGKSNLKAIVSYKAFQFFWTFYQFATMTIIIMANIKWIS